MTLLEHELDNLATSRLRELAAERATTPAVRAAVEAILEERDSHARRGKAFIGANFSNRPVL